MTTIRQVIDAAEAALTEAGIGSPRVDAELLAAHVAGTGRGRLTFTDVGPDFQQRYDSLVAQRARRIPLQHLTGTAAFGPVTVHVGPGVFIPRPETEALLEWALAQDLSAKPVIVDLCTGSAALALALAARWPQARVVAVDDSEDALRYARRNTAATAVELIRADVTAPDLLAAALDGQVDLLVANPPYVPDDAELEPEVAQHDPAHALFGGPDGMSVIDSIIEHALRLLRPGGRCAIEHDDTTSARTVDAFTRTGRFVDVTARYDLTGRPRFVTATRERLTA
ncbi:peptide chain release factor N(5)-glutamine methyltransferase [Mycobacterium sp. NPDC048908]|uniref:peptide chain release factor N(5)-glutamine methyltransferase n=1 Tax=Mycobacterium sp. NPDC048908 TaxID=3364292 RepID=UPI003714CF72